MKNGIVRFQFILSVPLCLCPFDPLHQPVQSPGVRQPRKRNSTKEYVRIYKPFMQNKPNSNPILHPKGIEQKADAECLKQRVYGSCNLKQFFIS